MLNMGAPRVTLEAFIDRANNTVEVHTIILV